MEIREDMPLLARHEGVWDGTYTYFNAANEKIDEHQSRSNRASTGSALRVSSPSATGKTQIPLPFRAMIQTAPTCRHALRPCWS